MIANSLFFYFFSFIAVFAAIMVILSRNTVYSVFFLILDFITIACLFIMMGAEFLGMIMLIVYVGAVAVLFLFVVMMLDINFNKNKISNKHILIGSLVSLVIFVELILVIKEWGSQNGFYKNTSINFNNTVSNTEAIGNILYTDNVHLFLLAGFILLTSMIGAIVLTYEKRIGVKKQNVFKQISRERRDAVKLVEVEKGKGVDLDV